jgi:predicted phosphodiesterase
MLYGIISDIHSNLEALNAALSFLQKKVDKIISLGDIIGYGPNPNECCETIKRLDISSIAGNHEYAVLDKTDINWFNKNARDAILWTKKELKQENIHFLSQLAEILNFDDFTIAHGSLRDPINEYIDSLRVAIGTFERMKNRICLVGHTHVPVIIGIREDGNYDGRLIKDNDVIYLGDYKKVIVNVGSVGQPRDGNPKAACGILDTEKQEISIFRLEYDIEAVQKKMEECNLPRPLIDRLSHGT